MNFEAKFRIGPPISKVFINVHYIFFNENKLIGFTNSTFKSECLIWKWWSNSELSKN